MPLLPSAKMNTPSKTYSIAGAQWYWKDFFDFTAAVFYSWAASPLYWHAPLTHTERLEAEQHSTETSRTHCSKLINLLGSPTMRKQRRKNCFYVLRNSWSLTDTCQSITNRERHSLRWSKKASWPWATATECMHINKKKYFKVYVSLRIEIKGIGGLHWVITP